MEHLLLRPHQHPEPALTIPAYSEFMPPPVLFGKPYGAPTAPLAPSDDPHGWDVTEYEETQELQPGLEHLAGQLMIAMRHLGHGNPTHGIAHAQLANNPFWPRELAERAGKLHQERYVLLAPLALSRTQDDKGRIRWTLFGGSEQGPERPFWQSFYRAPGREVDEQQGLDFFRRLLGTAYRIPEVNLQDLHQAGFRILPGLNCPVLPAHWQPADLPSWTRQFLLANEEQLAGVKYLLTFRPFSCLSRTIQTAYLEGRLHLLPFPGSLLFWGVADFLRLQAALPFATQIPLQHLFPRHENPTGIRVPQSGYLHEPHPNHPAPPEGSVPLRNSIRRTHRWQRTLRDADELAVDLPHEASIVTALFSTSPDHMGLYDKPMARNAQVWTHDHGLVLDGPHADRNQIRHAFEKIRGGGHFGYRFLYPAMRAGSYEVYWQRPLIACLPEGADAPTVLHGWPLGYLTAYEHAHPDLAHPIELWPNLLNRPTHRTALENFSTANQHPAHHQILQNIRKLLDAAELWGAPTLPASLAHALLMAPAHKTIEEWLPHLEQSAIDPQAGQMIARALRSHLSPASEPADPSTPITFEQTATRSFETRYWKTIVKLAHGRFRHKDNADCPTDGVSEPAYKGHHHRDLEALGDYLLAYYRRLVKQAGMTDQVLVGDFPFRWQTDFDFSWQGGWRHNQDGTLEERDILVIIPGRDRSRTVIMADHYDTAYMEDKYQQDRGGNGTRLSAAGADDNHSATATLMLGAREFLRLSQEGRLECDIWLVHLTGEEFPSDCLGARHLAQAIVQKKLRLRQKDGTDHDLSAVRIQGVYVLDMIAHNRDASDPHGRDVFQIAPGTGRAALQLAGQAHAANALWNAQASAWNQQPKRRTCERSERSADPHGAIVPATAQFPVLHGEVRTVEDPRSSLYNTDGQIFSDAGIPVVLFMENYDINRHGYHDTEDNMSNIDLDYGAAVAAIAIETVARAAS